METRRRLVRQALMWAWLAANTAFTALGGGCANAPPETTPAEGVFGYAPPAVGSTPSVLTLHAPGLSDMDADEESPVLDQAGLEFWPEELLVRVGQRMVFTNRELTSHNVYVRSTDSDSTVFNTDVHWGQSIEFVFDRQGPYDVTCNAHPDMHAFIYATETPYAAFADQEGYFLLPGVPPGTYTLSVWSVDPELRSQQTIDVSAGSTEVKIAPLPRPGRV